MNQQTEGLPKPLTQSPLGPSRSTNQPRNPVSWVQVFRFLRRPTMCPRKSHSTWSPAFTFWKEAVRIDAWLSDRACRVPPGVREAEVGGRGTRSLRLPGHLSFALFFMSGFRVDSIRRGFLLLRGSLETVSLSAGGCQLSSIYYTLSRSHMLFPTLRHRTIG